MALDVNSNRISTGLSAGEFGACSYMGHNLETVDLENAMVLKAFFALVFIGKISLQELHASETNEKV